LNPRIRRTALVKIQGPFTDVQLNSVARGMAQLQKLGLVSVIVVDRDDIPVIEPNDHVAAQRAFDITQHQRPLSLRGDVVVGLYHGDIAEGDGQVFVEEEGMDHVKRAVGEGEIPVLLPVALDTNCRSRRVGANPSASSRRPTVAKTGLAGARCRFKNDTMRSTSRNINVRCLCAATWSLGSITVNRHRAPARPVLATVGRLDEAEGDGQVFVEELWRERVRWGWHRLVVIGNWYRAQRGARPVALDTNCRSRRVGANPILLALAKVMSHPTAGGSTSNSLVKSPTTTYTQTPKGPLDLTPMAKLIDKWGMPERA
jgi:hypothetical protein